MLSAPGVGEGRSLRFRVREGLCKYVAFELTSKEFNRDHDIKTFWGSNKEGFALAGLD